MSGWARVCVCMYDGKQLPFSNMMVHSLHFSHTHLYGNCANQQGKVKNRLHHKMNVAPNDCSKTTATCINGDIVCTFFSGLQHFHTNHFLYLMAAHCWDHQIFSDKWWISIPSVSTALTIPWSNPMMTIEPLTFFYL